MRIRLNSFHAIRLSALFLMLMTFSYARAHQLATVAYMDSVYSDYPYLRFVEVGDSLVMSDEDFFDIAGKVVFPVNKSSLNPSDEFLRELDEKVLPDINRDSLQLVQLIIRGAASPEGPVKLNQKLGSQRAEALFNFIQTRLAFPLSSRHFSLDVDIEDYSTLCLMMRRANDPDYGFVKELTDRYEGQPAQLKQKLQTARGGQLWNRLLKEYFPGLRTARIVLVFRRYVPVELEEEEPVVSELDPVVHEQTPVVLVEPDLPEVEPLKVEAPVVAAEPVVSEPDTIHRREFLSVKTNLLFYGVYMPGYDRWCPIPNVAVEYYPKNGHFTFGASFDCPWWQDYDAHKYFQIRNYQVESRYYLRSGDMDANPPGQGPAFRGLYLQGYAHLGLFGICFDADRGWVGEGLGAGVGAGYVMGLSKKGHWRLEFGLQVGFYSCKYDPYQYENPVDPNYRDHLYYYKWTQDPSLFKKRQYRYSWLGPTRIGVTLTYDLLYRRVQKKGVSFINYEKRK